MKNLYINIKYNFLHNKICDIDSFPGFLYFKCRKDFIPPKINFYKFKTDSNFYIKDFISIDDSFIEMSDLLWKTKYGDYRFEGLPYLQIKIGKHKFVWTLESPDGDNYHYYEMMLNYLYKFNKDYQKTEDNNQWKTLIDGKWINVAKNYRK